jgi:hypothetical protein
VAAADEGRDVVGGVTGECERPGPPGESRAASPIEPSLLRTALELPICALARSRPIGRSVPVERSGSLLARRALVQVGEVRKTCGIREAGSAAHPAQHGPFSVGDPTSADERQRTGLVGLPLRHGPRTELPIGTAALVADRASCVRECEPTARRTEESRHTSSGFVVSLHRCRTRFSRSPRQNCRSRENSGPNVRVRRRGLERLVRR